MRKTIFVVVVLMAEFQGVKSRMDTFLASIRLSGPVKGDDPTL